MKAYRAGVQYNQVTSYDPTKVTLSGRCAQRNIDGVDVVGPPLTEWLDAFSDAGITPSTAVDHTVNDRIFIMSTIAAGAATIALYNFNNTTGAAAYVGKITIALPNTAATTHTIRGFEVLDTGTTGWKIFLLTTGSVLINGGLFVVNKVDYADFTPGGTALAMAQDRSGSDVKAVYFLQDPAGVGSGHAMTAGAGLFLDKTNNLCYVHNGVAATHQYWVFNYNAAMAVDKVSTVTITIATPGVVTYNSHGFNNNDQVVLTTTGALPTGLTAGTVYFVRNATTNTFELSATSGGASINTTGSQSGVHTISRAFGINSSTGFSFKTGNLPALTGTLILLDSERYAEPTHGHILTATYPCVVFPTTTNIYVGRLSELTNGATTWPSLNTVNILGATNESVAPTVAQGAWSTALDGFVYLTNTSTFVFKKLVNNQIVARFSGLSTQYLEGAIDPNPEFGFAAVAGFDFGNGWLTAVGNTAGQRGAIVFDLRSDGYFDYSSVITPTFPSDGIQARFIATIEKLYDITSTTSFYYRTGSLTDPMFASASGGWAPFDIASDLSVYALDELVQIKILWDLASTLSSTPAQIADLVFGYQPDDELSDQWQFSHEFSISTSPAKTAFRLDSQYLLGVVPPLYFRAYDTNGVLVVAKDTINDAAEFQKSTDGGLTWGAIGTIANTVGTLLRYNWSTPPGVDVSVSIRED